MKVTYHVAGNICRELIFAICSFGRILLTLHPFVFVKCQLPACLLLWKCGFLCLYLKALHETSKRVVSLNAQRWFPLRRCLYCGGVCTVDFSSI